jgi:hypothetical protein
MDNNGTGISFSGDHAALEPAAFLVYFVWEVIPTTAMLWVTWNIATGQRSSRWASKAQERLTGDGSTHGGQYVPVPLRSENMSMHGPNMGGMLGPEGGEGGDGYNVNVPSSGMFHDRNRYDTPPADSRPFFSIPSDGSLGSIPNIARGPVPHAMEGGGGHGGVYGAGGVMNGMNASPYDHLGVYGREYPLDGSTMPEPGGWHNTQPQPQGQPQGQYQGQYRGSGEGYARSS